jgi:hypothetical protein
MRKVFLMLMIVVVAGSAFVFGSRAENVSVRGDYVEVRTASVFAGACHYNGEVVTTGREAMMAWNVTSGKWQGIDLTNVRVLAIVSSDSNLGDKNAARKSEIVIDSASRSQSLAVLDAIKQKYAASLGEIIKVRNAPIKFAHEDKSYAVAADDATMAVEAMPNDLCCKMPNLVWYTPLVGLENRKVGYTTNAAYSGNSVGEQWSRAGENSAFYGSFSF